MHVIEPTSIDETNEVATGEASGNDVGRFQNLYCVTPHRLCNEAVSYDNGIPKSEMEMASSKIKLPLSALMIIVICFAGITGLLMGYDLCVIAVVLDPISTEFELCPAPEATSNIALMLEEPVATVSNRRMLSDRYCSFSSLGQLGTLRRGLEEGVLSESQVYHSCVPKELFVSMVSPGAALGSLTAGFIADAGGRKLTLGLSDVFIMTGTFMMGLGHTFRTLLIGRFILGLGVGTGFVIFSTYVSEISPDNRRGQLVACQEVAQCVGCLLAYMIAAFKQSEEWRGLLVGAGVVAAIQSLGVLILPESPRWLIGKNKAARAEVALRRLSGLPKNKKDVTEILAVPSRETTETVINGLPTSRAQTYSRGKIEKAKIKRQTEEARELIVVETMMKMTRELEKEKLQKTSLKKLKADESRKREAPEESVLPKDVPFLPSMIEFEAQKDQSTEDMTNKWRRSGSCSTTVEEDSEGRAIPNMIQPDFYISSASLIDPMDNQDNVVTNKSCFISSFKAPCRDLYNLCQFHKWQLFVALGCATCQNLTASTAILYYSTDLYHLAGVSNALLAGIGIGVAKVIGITTVILFVEQVGRKRFLLMGSCGTLFCHLMFALLFLLRHLFLPNESIDTWTAVTSVVTMTLYMFFQNISWAGLMFVVASEVLPSSVRGIGMGFTITWFWVLAFVTQGTLETLMELVTIPGVFLLYAFTNTLVVIFTWYFIPEFSGKSLEEIAETYG